MRHVELFLLGLDRAAAYKQGAIGLPDTLHCHLEPIGSGKLRNITGMVNPEGCLLVSGIDLDVRGAAASDRVPGLIEEIQEGDPSACGDWSLSTPKEKISRCGMQLLSPVNEGD
jgi:hypothetical protein